MYEFITRFNIREVGFDMAIVSDVPLGSGLSSSASLEVAVSVFLEQILNQPISPEDRALLCQAAEHNFPRMPCGVMDQFISSCGVRGNLLLIDCRANKGELVPMNDPSVSIIVCNSNKKHQLTGSEYPDRVRQCKEAVAVLATHYPDVKALRDATVEQVESVKNELGDLGYRRALHVVSECQRCLDCKQALEARDYEKVGQLLLESHASLRDNYEVSTPEIDALVEIAVEQNGVFGARITGGGFGGCIVCLVESREAKNVIRALEMEYKQRTGIECSAFVTAPSEGAHAMTLEDERKCTSCVESVFKSPFFWFGTALAVSTGLFLLLHRRNHSPFCYKQATMRTARFCFQKMPFPLSSRQNHELRPVHGPNRAW